MTPSIIQRVNSIARQCIQRHWTLATAESCTGGGLAYALTALPGSSTWFERGFITYSNTSKEELLGIDSFTLNQHGAVSEATVKAMAEGALHHSQANISIAITGIAGPDGGSAEKPVGTVWFGWAIKKGETEAICKHFQGTRQKIREQAIAFALEKLETLTSPFEEGGLRGVS